MTSETAAKRQETGALVTAADRIHALEAALDLDKRLDVVEGLLRDKRFSDKPWWRDAKTITVLGALVAAVLPVLTWINNAYTSSRESHRLFIEQQEKIRQTYLDRVLRPGVTEAEQQRVFNLLSRLSSDPELQKWAQDELQRTTETISALNKEKEELQRHLGDSEFKLASLNERMRKLTDDEKRQRIETAQLVASLQKRIEVVNQQMDVKPSSNPESEDERQARLAHEARQALLKRANQ